jgi:hypothetical protein
MKKLLVTMTAICALLAPVAASAAGTPSASAVAASLCKQEQAKMTPTDFQAAYGATNTASAYGKCVLKNAKLAQQDVNNAAKSCTAEQADANFAANHGGKTFDQFYGATPGKNADANAYGKCVSSKVKSATASQAAKAASAARSCRADLKADKAAFATKWGTGTNAFGRCVASTAKAK